MTSFDADLVARWFRLSQDNDRQDVAGARLTATERRVLGDGAELIAAAVQWNELPDQPEPASEPAARVLQVYLTGLATGVAGARQSMADADDTAGGDRLALVAGLIAGGAAVQAGPGSEAVDRSDAAALARTAGTAAAELVVDGADLHAITSAAAAGALIGGPPDGANRDPRYRAEALVGLTLTALQLSTAPPGEPVRPPSCGARPGVNNGAGFLAEVTFTMFAAKELCDRLEATISGLSEEVVVFSEADRRYFHVHTGNPGEVIAEAYAVGSVFSLVIGNLG